MKIVGKRYILGFGFIVMDPRDELEQVIAGTFLKGYNLRLNPTYRRATADAVGEVMSPETVKYLSDTDFDLGKTVQLFDDCDSVFDSIRKKHPDSSVRALKLRNNSTFFPLFFIERIRIPFLRGLPKEQEDALREEYHPKGWQAIGDGAIPYNILRKNMLFNFSVSENEAAKPERTPFLDVRLNLYLSAVKHALEGSEFGKEHDAGYFGYLGTYFLSLGEALRGLYHHEQVVRSLTSEVSGEILAGSQNTSEHLQPHSKLCNLILDSSGDIGAVSKFCFEQSKAFYEQFFPKLDESKTEGDSKKTYATNRVNLGKVNFYLAHSSTNKRDRDAFLKESRMHFAESRDCDEEDLGRFRNLAILCRLSFGETGK